MAVYSVAVNEQQSMRRIFFGKDGKKACNIFGIVLPIAIKGNNQRVCCSLHPCAKGGTLAALTGIAIMRGVALFDTLLVLPDGNTKIWARH